nr:hypothetical protein [Lachnospiraceae bacterium]
MSFWKKLFSRQKKYRDIDELIDEELRMEEEEKYVLSIDQIDMKNAGDRERYVLSLLEQIADASAQIESCKEEYNTVNRYLQDMEDLEYIQGEDKNSLTEYAKAISLLETDKIRYEEKKQRLKDEDFIRMEKLEENAEEGIRKLTEAEQYQQAIRSDMMRLENEKQACLFRKQEASAAMENLRGMALICTVALFACMGMLMIMQFALEMETTVGYILTAAVAAIALTAMYMKYVEAAGEKKRSAHSLNKVILLQNRVKIRYVNNTNLVDYLYMKYGVSSAKELISIWERYLAEREERAKIKETMKDLSFTQDQLVRLLRKYNLYDPVIWLHQVEAILNPKEMVEVRHALIARRQKLRKQMEFNTNNAENAQQQVKELVGEYPQYAKEILKMVSDYEDKYPTS